MAEPIPSSHLDLFEKKAIAHLGVHLPTGSIQINPVWCNHEDGHVLINSAQGRVKDKAMRANAAVTVCISDPDNVFRFLEVRGKVVEITTDGADAHIDALAKKYLGLDQYPNRREGEVRVMYRIEPEKVVAKG